MVMGVRSSYSPNIGTIFRVYGQEMFILVIVVLIFLNCPAFGVLFDHYVLVFLLIVVLLVFS
jgi:hypothetical protein